MPYLNQLNRSGTTVKSWMLMDEQLMVGRGEGLQATIEDHEMSRKHFAIEKEGDDHVLVDQGSTNGTFVNDEKAQQRKLKEGDRIRAGSTTFAYEFGMSTMIGQVEKKSGRSIQDELKDLYKKA